MRTPKRAAPPDKSKPPSPVKDSPAFEGPKVSTPEHLGDQFEIVYHSSYYAVPPHRMDPPDNFEEYDNASPDYFHAGTRAAAVERAEERSVSPINREYLHVYRVDKSKVHPVTYGDDANLHSNFDRKILNTAMKNKNILQPELFEDLPVEYAMYDSKTAIPYRNAAEDRGSVSYAIPKSVVAHKMHTDSDVVQYLGVEPTYPKLHED